MLAICDYIGALHGLEYGWYVAAEAGAWFIPTRLVYQNCISDCRTSHAVLI